MTARNLIILLSTTALACLVVFISFSFTYENDHPNSAISSDKLALEITVTPNLFPEPQQNISPQIIDANRYLPNPAELITKQSIKCSHDGCSEAEALFVNNRSPEAEVLLIKKLSSVTAGIENFELSDWELYRSILRSDGRLAAYTSALQSIPDNLGFKQSLLVEHLSYLSQNHTDAETQAFALSALSINPTNELLAETYAEILAAQNKLIESYAIVAHLQKLNPESEFVLRFLKRIELDQSLSN